MSALRRTVFVSYSQPDRDCAFELVARIESQAIGCWIAPRDISPSADWAEEIIDAISGAKVMVLVVSAASNASPQVRREVERAVHKQLKILPFRIEDIVPSRALEYFLSAQQWLDAFPPPREPHYARVCDYLRDALGDAATSGSGATSGEAVLDTRQPAITAAEPGHVPAPVAAGHAVGAQKFDAAELQSLQTQLAGYIGPVAKHLVKHSASRASGMEDLVRKLCAEIESESDRRQFSRDCEWLKHPRA